MLISLVISLEPFIYPTKYSIKLMKLPRDVLATSVSSIAAEWTGKTGQKESIA